MSVLQIRQLVDEYYDLLKAKTEVKGHGDWVEIEVPFLDRHNDFIQIYTQCVDGRFLLSDFGNTISDLEMSGCPINTAKRQEFLETTLRGFGIDILDGELHTSATKENFGERKHSLIQAIISVNDMFYTSKQNVSNFFIEDVGMWLDMADIRYTSRISLIGKSHFYHKFDYVISGGRNVPERVLKVINNPNRDSASSFAFSWYDTRDNRAANAKAFAILNDSDKKVPSAVADALMSYEIQPIYWSERSKYLDVLAA